MKLVAYLQSLSARFFHRSQIEADMDEELRSGGTPSLAMVFEVTGNYFDVFRVQPHLGRFFHASDKQGSNGAAYIVLT